MSVIAQGITAGSFIVDFVQSRLTREGLLARISIYNQTTRIKGAEVGRLLFHQMLVDGKEITRDRLPDVKAGIAARDYDVTVVMEGSRAVSLHLHRKAVATTEERKSKHP